MNDKFVTNVVIKYFTKWVFWKPKPAIDRGVWGEESVWLGHKIRA